MQDWDNSFLKLRIEMDEHISAADKVQVGERWVSRQVLLGKHACISDGF